MWWFYAHYLARKQKMSIRKMLRREQLAGNFGIIEKDKRARKTFSITVGKKKWVLNIFPPKKVSIRAITGKQN